MSVKEFKLESTEGVSIFTCIDLRGIAFREEGHVVGNRLDSMRNAVYVVGAAPCVAVAIGVVYFVKSGDRSLYSKEVAK